MARQPVGPTLAVGSGGDLDDALLESPQAQQRRSRSVRGSRRGSAPQACGNEPLVPRLGDGSNAVDTRQHCFPLARCCPARDCEAGHSGGDGLFQSARPPHEVDPLGASLRGMAQHAVLGCSEAVTGTLGFPSHTIY